MFGKCQNCGSTNGRWASKTIKELNGDSHVPFICGNCGKESYGKPLDFRKCTYPDYRTEAMFKSGGDLYDIKYYEGMLRNYSATAEMISHIRWEFVSQVSPKFVLDYGCGVGWFRAFRPESVVVDTYDIADFVQTGIQREFYDLVCFWDVLEHIPNFETIEAVLESTTYIAITIPIKPEKQVLNTWKHFKPNEHLHYFTKESVQDMFSKVGFYSVKDGQPECPPRVDICSFLFERGD